MFAVLGKDIIFEVVGSPRNLRMSRGYDYSKHKVVTAPPRLQWLANDLAELTIELLFHVRFTKPLAQLNALYAAAQDHVARALVFQNGVHKGYWVITAVEEKPQHLASDGSIIAIEVEVRLQEWVLGSEVALATAPTPANPPIGVVIGPPSSSSTAPGSSTPGAPTLGGSTSNPPTLNELIANLGGSSLLAGPTLGGPSYAPPGFAVPGASAVSSGLPSAAAVTPSSPTSYTSVAPKRIVGSPS